MSVPGIGAKLADKILELREAKGHVGGKGVLLYHGRKI
jgi:hypothetical protein